MKVRKESHPAGSIELTPWLEGRERTFLPFPKTFTSQVPNFSWAVPIFEEVLPGRDSRQHSRMESPQKFRWDSCVLHYAGYTLAAVAGMLWVHWRWRNRLRSPLRPAWHSGGRFWRPIPTDHQGDCRDRHSGIALARMDRHPVFGGSLVGSGKLGSGCGANTALNSVVYEPGRKKPAPSS